MEAEGVVKPPRKSERSNNAFLALIAVFVTFRFDEKLPVCSGQNAGSNEDSRHRYAARMQRRRAEKAVRDKFSVEHQATFDSFGHIIRYGTDADAVTCDRKGEQWDCFVSDYSKRKYLTTAEQMTAKQLKANKQEELDRGAGLSSGPEGAVKRARFKKEQKARCRVFAEWMEEFDKIPDKQTFFRSYLSCNYEDFSSYRAIAKRGTASRKEKKKAKKLKRRITLNIHQDKLPPSCRQDDVRSMMADIMTHIEELEDCIESPHKCNPQDL